MNNEAQKFSEKMNKATAKLEIRLKKQVEQLNKMQAGLGDLAGNMQKTANELRNSATNYREASRKITQGV